MKWTFVPTSCLLEYYKMVLVIASEEIYVFWFKKKLPIAYISDGRNDQNLVDLGRLTIEMLAIKEQFF